MKKLIPYVVFPGTCKEAMGFYAEVFNGKITLMQTFGESPMPVPPELAHRIFNSELKAEGIHFKASDDLPSHAVTVGTNISLFAVFEDKKSRWIYLIN